MKVNGDQWVLMGINNILPVSITFYYNGPLVCISFWLHHLLFGVRVNAADYKLVSFFVTADKG